MSFLLPLLCTLLLSGNRVSSAPQSKNDGDGTLVKLTRITCISQNASLVVVRECLVRPVSRYVGKLSARIGLQPPPWYSVIVNAEVFRKYNAYQPFIINYTMDICAFLRHRQHPFFKHLYELGGRNHNVNHSCPYQEDLIVRDFSPNGAAVKLPLPIGQYKMVTKTYGRRNGRLFYVLLVELFFEILTAWPN